PSPVPSSLLDSLPISEAVLPQVEAVDGHGGRQPDRPERGPPVAVAEPARQRTGREGRGDPAEHREQQRGAVPAEVPEGAGGQDQDRKSTRLNSSHVKI